MEKGLWFEKTKIENVIVLEWKLHDIKNIKFSFSIKYYIKYEWFMTDCVYFHNWLCLAVYFDSKCTNNKSEKILFRKIEEKNTIKRSKFEDNIYFQ